MVEKWYVVFMIIMMVMSMTISICNHGKKEGTHNGVVAIVATIIWVIIAYFGGFFSVL